MLLASLGLNRALIIILPLILPQKEEKKVRNGKRSLKPAAHSRRVKSKTVNQTRTFPPPLMTLDWPQAHTHYHEFHPVHRVPQAAGNGKSR